MDKNITKRFREKVFNRALDDARRLLDTKGERMKLFTQLLLWGIFLALTGMLAYFGLTGLVEAFKIILGAILGNFLLLLYFYTYPFILAYLNRWKYAAILHNEMGGFDSPNIKVDVNKIVNMRSWVTVQITNNSRFPIKDCFIKIIDIKPPMITNLTDDVILEWADHFRGQSKIDIGINDGLQRHIANSVVASWIGNEQEWKVFIFTTEEPYKEHKFIGVPQKYLITLEINGTYLWKEYKQKEIVEIEPVMGESLVESSINIRRIENNIAQ